MRDLPINYVFYDVGLGPHGSNKVNIASEQFDAISIQTALETNGHTTGIDFLKFDVEGYEYHVLENTAWDKVKVGGLFFEVHANIKIIN